MKTNLISSVQNETIKKLKKIQNDNKSKYFIIEGYHLVEEALKHNLVKDIYELDKNNKYPNATKITDNVLKALSKTKTPEGVIALCLKSKNNKIGNKVVFLENVQDPGNVGTIIRTTLAFGFDTVISNVNFYNDKIIRSTQGSLFNINLINYNDASLMFKKLHKENYTIYMSSLEKDSVDFNQIDYNKVKLVIVMGNEGNGINKTYYKYADKKIYIPIKFESLNVAVATGIVLNKVSNE